MAYQKKNIVDYFPHTVNHGRKMFIIRSQYGNDGYAVWFMILEQLGKADNHYLNLSDKTQVLYLLADFKVSEELFYNIIKTLVDLDEFDRDLWDGANIVYSKKFIESIVDAYKRRSNNMLHYDEICKQFLKKRSSINKSDYNIQQSKLEESKSKETKLEESKVNNKVYTKDVHDCLENCLMFFPEHLQPKKEHKKNWLDTIDKLNRIEKVPFDIIEGIVKKTRNDNFWSGVFLSIPKLRKKNKEGIMNIIVFNESLKNGKSNTKEGRGLLEPTKENAEWLTEKP